MRGHATELEIEVDEDDPVGLGRRRRDGHVGRDRRGADSALGAEDRDRSTGVRHRHPVRRDHRSEILGPLESEQQGFDPRFELAVVEGPCHYVVRTSLEEPDAFLDIVALADAEDRDRREGRRLADLAAHVHGIARAGDLVDDDQLLRRDEPECLVRCARHRDGVTEPREAGGHRLGESGVRVDKEDRTDGHCVSGWRLPGRWRRARDTTRIHREAASDALVASCGPDRIASGVSRATRARLRVHFLSAPCRICVNGASPQEGVARRMRRYELMLVVRPDVPDDRGQAVIDRTTRQLVTAGGQIVKVAPWGRRRLAYPIDRHREGSYHIVVFEAPPEAIAELERTLLITEDVLRHLVTRVERPARSSRGTEYGDDEGGDEVDLPRDDEDDGDDREQIDESESEAAPAAID